MLKAIKYFVYSILSFLLFLLVQTFWLDLVQASTGKDSVTMLGLEKGGGIFLAVPLVLPFVLMLLAIRSVVPEKFMDTLKQSRSLRILCLLLAIVLALSLLVSVYSLVSRACLARISERVPENIAETLTDMYYENRFHSRPIYYLMDQSDELVFVGANFFFSYSAYKMQVGYPYEITHR